MKYKQLPSNLLPAVRPAKVNPLGFPTKEDVATREKAIRTRPLRSGDIPDKSTDVPLLESPKPKAAKEGHSRRRTRTSNTSTREEPKPKVIPVVEGMCTAHKAHSIVNASLGCQIAVDYLSRFILKAPRSCGCKAGEYCPHMEIEGEPRRVMAAPRRLA